MNIALARSGVSVGSAVERPDVYLFCINTGRALKTSYVDAAIGEIINRTKEKATKENRFHRHSDGANRTTTSSELC